MLKNRLVDIEKKVIPIGATKIENNFICNKKYIEEFIIKDLRKLNY